MPRILFVSGFHPSTRARDLAFEFERYATALLRPRKHASNRSHHQLWPLNPLRCPRPTQPIRTFESVGPFPPSFLPALSQQRHECPLYRRTFARRLRTRTRMHASFHFDFERRLPRHSISRRVRTKAQHPSTVAVMHSSNFAALATLRTPIMTCMYNLTHAFLSIPNHHLFFPSQARTHVRGFASRHTGEPSLTMSIQRS
jgi:hypothetical protein